MSQLVKTKRQANFNYFKLFGAFKVLVEQKNVVFNSFVCKLDYYMQNSLLHNNGYYKVSKKKTKQSRRCKLSVMS
jgi:hypothetical protein